MGPIQAVSLMVIIIFPLANTQQAITDHNVFVPFSDPVVLRVVNITQFTAHLEWNIPSETISRLKAMRINCTTLKSLIEPYENSHPIITLYNPSISGKQTTLRDLQPSTQYSCNLVGALSLDVGREKLAILSQPATFATLMEKEDSNSNESYQANSVNIALGTVGGLLVVIIACIIIFIGYRKYKQSNKDEWRDGNTRKKFRMRLSKKKDVSPPFSPSKPGPSPDKHSKKSRDPERKVKKDKFKPTSDKAKPPRDRDKVKRNKSDKPSDGKPSGSNKSRNKKPSKKKQQNSKFTHAYAYSELQTRSSEDEIFGYKDTELKHELTSDLGWDPMNYYPHKPYIPEPIKAKRIGKKDTSSPALVVKSHDEEDSPSTYAKGEYYQPQFAQPLY